MTCRSGIRGKKSLKMDDPEHIKDADEEKIIKDLIASHLKFR
jgi:hypothetical protein